MRQDKSDPEYLPIMESFYTIQGEGYHAGKAAYFIRLGGCDVGCHWCDVKESWNATQYPWASVDTLTKEPKTFGASTVVITGGEPFIYDLSKLTGNFKDAGIKTNVETSGAYPLTGSWDWLCFSPKKFKKPRKEFYKVCNELKVVIFNKSDFEWALGHAGLLTSKTLLYLQPEWSKSAEMIPLIVDFVKKHPEWQISLQTHKYMDVP